ncbi:GNAT family N-acetyltransferase [Pelomyxa schiedti]|nr:GNAT family N-acetyltransferase [Pelomyxa schiedti]
MMEVTVREAVSEVDHNRVHEMVRALLVELGPEAEDADKATPDPAMMMRQYHLRCASGQHIALLAFVPGKEEPVGVLTLSECFAIYAGGNYGIINEMYVAPAYRCRKVGDALVQRAIAYAQSRLWSRVDVTAPEDPAWVRTRAFYERLGFGFAGPKLKIVIPQSPASSTTPQHNSSSF